MDVVLEHVDLEFTATKLTAAASVSDTTIEVETTIELNEESGGDLRINGVDYVYDSADPETGVVTLSTDTPISVAADVDDIVYVLAGDDIGQTKWAVVTIPGSETGEPIPFRIHDLDVDYYKLGDEQAGAVLSVGTDERGRPVVTGRPGQHASRDASNDYNIPDPAAVAVDPPATSPAIVSLTGNSEGIMVVVEPTLPTTLIDYYVNGVAVEVDQRTNIIQLSFEDLAHTDPMVVETDYAIHTQAHNSATDADPSTLPAASAAVTTRLNPGMTATQVVALLQAGMILTGAIFVGTFMTINQDGITITHPDGRQTYMRADGSGNQFVGQAILDAATILGSLTILGLDNFLNGLLTLGTGVGDPTSMPGVTSSGYDSEEFTNPFLAEPAPDDYRRGLFWTGTQWLTTSAAPFGYGTSLWDTAADDTFTGAPMPGGFRPIGGAVQISTNYYVLGKDDARGGDWWVFVFNSSWTKTSEWEPAGSAAESLTIGVDGTSLLIAKRTVANNLYVSTYTTGGTESAFVLCGTWAGAELTGVHKRAVDTATARFVVASSTAIRVFNTGTGARITGEEWTPAATPVRGLGHDGTNWFTHDGAHIWEYTNLIGTWDFGFTWVDDNATGGTHETGVSTIRTATPVKRSQWTVSLPSPPPDDGTTDGANTANLYAVATGGTLVLQTALAEGTLSATYSTLATVGAAPPVNNFGAGQFGRIISGAVDGSSDPIIELRGDGPGRVGPFVWDEDGEGVSHRQGVASVTVTASATGTQSVTFSPAFVGAPIISLAVIGTSSYFAYTTGGASTTGMTVGVRHYAGTTATTTINVHWTAREP